MNKKIITFVTGNNYKLQAAKATLKDTGIKIIQRRISLPEIQDESVEKIAMFSASWAANILKKPVMVSDGGCYIETLNGFPGPFIKYINKWFSPADLLRLMSGKINRRVVWVDCVACCKPDIKPLTSTKKYKGRLARKPGKNIYRKDYGWIDTLFIPDGHEKPISEMPTLDYIKFWDDDQELVKIINKITEK